MMSLQKEIPVNMVANPTVFAMKNTYQIFMPFSCEVIVWVRVGENIYYDESNGILRSNTNMHRVEVPMEELDRERAYTVVYRKMIERKPYFPTSEDDVEITFDFKPVTGDPIRIYHVSDAHNLVKSPVAAGQYWGEDLDLLVLNGDIPNHSGKVENFNAVCEIASGITGGSRPVVFSRGNHDTRGICAENFAEYTPTENGKTYYTFRVGNVWGMVLDCGEDKPDTNAEYGHTICFHQFRLRETQYIKDVIRRAAEEYDAPDVKHKLIICHIPFTYINHPPFDIEQELYGEWCALLREYIKPELLLFGHNHATKIWPVGCEQDHQGQPCPAIIGSRPFTPNKERPEEHFHGCAVALDGEQIRVIFNTDTGEILEDTVL
jgi:hypothetical protein